MGFVRYSVAVLVTTTLTGGLLVFDVVSLPSSVPESVAPEMRSVALAGLTFTRSDAGGEVVLAETEAPEETDAPDATDAPEAPGGTGGTDATEAPATSPPVSTAGSVAASVPDLMSAPSAAVLETEVIETEEFSVLGVTWDGDFVSAGQVAVEVSVLESAGWSSWTALDLNDAGPDDGTEEAAMAFDVMSTEPLVTASADAVKVRLTTSDGEVPEGAQVVTIDPGASAADPTGTDSAAITAAEASLYKPAVVTRAQWGADERLRRCNASYSSTVTAAAVHHTAGSNGYSKSQSAGIVRGIYAYHTGSLGWCDVGYNALVDRFGTIYEGRHGGIERAVRGAHSGGFNDMTFGVAAIGNYDTVSAPTAMIQSIGRVIGWKLGLFDRNVDGTTTLTSAGGGTSRYAAGRQVTLPTVFSHRDVGYTACPGRYIVSQMPVIRSTAGLYSADTNRAHVLSLESPAGGRSVSLAYDVASGRVSVGRLESDGTVAPTYTATWSAGWDVMAVIESDRTRGDELLLYDSVRGVREILDLGGDSRFTRLSHGSWSKGWDVVLPVDVTGDGADELLVYNSTSGRRWMLRVSASGGLSAIHGGGWSKGWDVILDVETDGTTGAEIVTYNSVTGRRWLLDLYSNGGTRAISGGNWSTGWKTVVAADVPGRSGSQLLFHNPGNGRQTVVGISKSGGLSELSSSTWTNGYSEVVMTEFDGTAGDEVIYFNPSTERRATADVRSTGAVVMVTQP